MKQTLTIIATILSIFCNAQVGIGTASPSVELDIESSASTTTIDINNTAVDGDPIINFQLGGVTTFAIGIDDGDIDKLKIGTSAIGTSTRITINSTGQVGIGTTSPNAVLEVEDNAIPATNDVILKVTADDSNPYAMVIGNDTYSTTENEGLTFYVGDAGGSYIEAKGTSAVLGIGVNGTNGDDIYVTSTEVVVNEGSYSTLDFRVESDINTNMFIVDASASLTGVGGTVAGAFFASTVNWSTGWAGGFVNGGNNVDRYGVFIQCGENTPAGGTNYVLGVYDGDGDYEGAIENISGTLTLTSVSDRRVKKNIQNTEITGLNIIDNIRIVDYQRIGGKEDAMVHHGFIAQELAKVFPYAVSPAPDGRLAIAPSFLIPILVKSEQEQQDEIIELQSQIDQLIQINEDIVSLILKKESISINQSEEILKKIEAIKKSDLVKKKVEGVENRAKQINEAPEFVIPGPTKAYLDFKEENISRVGGKHQE